MGESVLITGGASGIGAAYVEAFAAQGATVSFLDFDEVAARELTAQEGLQVTFLQRCDLRDVAAL